MMPRMRKKPFAETTEEVQLTVRLTPEGFERARTRIAELEAQARARAARELREVMDSVRERNVGFSEEEIEADIAEAVEEVRAERYRRATQR